jgi:hypothetical protein
MDGFMKFLVGVFVCYVLFVWFCQTHGMVGLWNPK